jgi:hypothetical protein
VELTNVLWGCVLHLFGSGQAMSNSSLGTRDSMSMRIYTTVSEIINNCIFIFKVCSASVNKIYLSHLKVYGFFRYCLPPVPPRNTPGPNYLSYFYDNSFFCIISVSKKFMSNQETNLSSFIMRNTCLMQGLLIVFTYLTVISQHVCVCFTWMT